MKNAFKMLWLIIAVMFVFGLVLAAVGFATGAARHIRATPSGVELVKQEVVWTQKTETDSAAFSNVELDFPATWTSIAFEQSDHYGYQVKLPMRSAVTLRDSVEDGTLKIGLKSDQSFWGDLNLDWRNFNFLVNGWSGSEKGAVTIYVPQDAQLDTVKLDFAAGKYDVGPLAARKVSVNCPAGDVQIAGITADTVGLNLTSGSMRAKKIEATTLTGSLTMGELYLSEVHARAASLSGTTGELYFTGDATEKLDVSLTAGDATLTLARPRNAYALFYDSSVGDLTVNGRSTGHLHEADPALTQLTVSTTAGNASLSFK